MKTSLAKTWGTPSLAPSKSPVTRAIDVHVAHAWRRYGRGAPPFPGLAEAEVQPGLEVNQWLWCIIYETIFYTYVYIYIHIWIYIYMCVYIYVYIYICIYICIYIYVCVCACYYSFMYVFIYLFISYLCRYCQIMSYITNFWNWTGWLSLQHFLSIFPEGGDQKTCTADPWSCLGSLPKELPCHALGRPVAFGVRGALGPEQFESPSPDHIHPSQVRPTSFVATFGNFEPFSDIPRLEMQWIVVMGIWTIMMNDVHQTPNIRSVEEGHQCSNRDSCHGNAVFLSPLWAVPCYKSPSPKHHVLRPPAVHRRSPARTHQKYHGMPRGHPTNRAQRVLESPS